jgi:hypothetical protein
MGPCELGRLNNDSDFNKDATYVSYFTCIKNYNTSVYGSLDSLKSR